ncbi:MAG TPA: serine hydrolase [Anaerolineaceae bacterium]
MKPENMIPRCAPEEVGVASGAVLKFVDDAQRMIRELHSFMLVRHGKVAAEAWWKPCAPERPHMLFSLSKSFTSTGIGLAVAEGKLSIDDPVLKFFPDDAPETVSDHLASLKVRHLLAMASGHAEDTIQRVFEAQDGRYFKAFLSLPIEHEPGTFFCYNNGCTFMLAAIIQKVTGQQLIDYLQPRLFEPLGIEGARWDLSPAGTTMGFTGLHVKTEDIARLGMLYLNRGVWNGQRLLPEAWVAQATAKQVANDQNDNPDWQQGYGFQFWRCQHGAFRGDGAFGQYCLVLPEQDTVIAITSGTNNMQVVLDLVWQDLLPALAPQTLPADPQGVARLRERLASLVYQPPAGLNAVAMAERVSGREYQVEANPYAIDQVIFDFGADGCKLSLREGQKVYTVRLGNGAWLEGETEYFQKQPMNVVASGVWLDAATYQATMRFFETPFVHTLVCSFNGRQVVIEGEINVGFGERRIPTLKGKCA